MSKVELYAAIRRDARAGMALTQKTVRQSIPAGSPPATGHQPQNCPASAVTWLTPSAIPRCEVGKASVRIAAELAVSITPPNA